MIFVGLFGLYYTHCCNLLSNLQELFIQCLAQTAFDRKENQKNLVYGDLAEIVDTDEAFQFLSGIVPNIRFLFVLFFVWLCIFFVCTLFLVFVVFIITKYLYAPTEP